MKRNEKGGGPLITLNLPLSPLIHPVWKLGERVGLEYPIFLFLQSSFPVL